MKLFDVLCQSEVMRAAGLPQAPLFLIDNVAMFYFDHRFPDPHPRHFNSTYPNLAPPFPSYFMEWTVRDIRLVGKQPKVGLHVEAQPTAALPIREHSTLAHSFLKALNCLHTLPPLDPLEGSGPFPVTLSWPTVVHHLFGHEDILAALRDVPHEQREALLARILEGELLALHITKALPREPEVRHAVLSAVKWDVTATEFMTTADHSFSKQHTTRYFVQPSGQMLPHGPTVDMIWTRDDATTTQVIHFDIALLATSLLHCRNVQVTTQNPPPSLIKRTLERHGIRLHRYHLLDIQPMRTVLRREGQIARHGLRRALHICRGHFKDFRTRGLFGKHKDIYWWGNNVRGSIEHGQIDKDYRILPPPGERSDAPL